MIPLLFLFLAFAGPPVWTLCLSWSTPIMPSTWPNGTQFFDKGIKLSTLLSTERSHRDIAVMTEFAINAVRVFHVDPTPLVDHHGCMRMLGYVVGVSSQGRCCRAGMAEASGDPRIFCSARMAGMYPWYSKKKATRTTTV